MNKPLISIIIPVYNVEVYIERCLNSILKQDIEPDLIEVVIIDDGSSDNSKRITKKYQKQYSNIRVYSQENRGVSVARNKGIFLSEGEYLLFIDSDDEVIENSLQKIFNQLKLKKPEMLILNSFRVKLNSNSTPIPVYPFPKYLSDKKFIGTELFKYYIRGSIWGVVFSKQFIDRYEIMFNKEFRNGEDALFFAMCLIYAQNISYCNIDYYIAHERSGSAHITWDFNKLLQLSNNLYQINTILTKHNFISLQSSILYSLSFRIISQLLYNYFQLDNKKRADYNVLKSHCISSGVYPIILKDIPRQKLKIRLLNISFDIFAFMFYLRAFIYRFILSK